MKELELRGYYLLPILLRLLRRMQLGALGAVHVSASAVALR